MHLENAGIIGSENEFEEQAKGSFADREALARAYLEHKGRDLASAGVNPYWADGLQRLAAHAKAHGFRGVVFFIDELLLCLSGKSVPEFKRAINQLKHSRPPIRSWRAKE